METDMHVRVFSDNAVLTVSDDYHEVSLFTPEQKLKKGFGYVNGNYVYVYRGKMSKVENAEDLQSGIYQLENGEYKFIEHSEKDAPMFHITNVVEFDLEKILDEITTKEDSFVNPEDIEIINNNSEVYKPTIREDDDFLKYIVKRAILLKQVNLKNYRTLFANQFTLNNMKSGLNKDTKMTVTNFKIWCEVLGLKFKMEVSDNGEDRLNPLPENIVVDSEEF